MFKIHFNYQSLKDSVEYDLCKRLLKIIIFRYVLIHIYIYIYYIIFIYRIYIYIYILSYIFINLILIIFIETTKLINLLMVQPSTSMSCERSFSMLMLILRRLKTWLTQQTIYSTLLDA